MALIVETGQIVEGANTYVDLTEVRAYAGARGVTVSDDDAVLSGQIINAMDYLEGFEPRFRGNRVSAAQSLSWPRKNVVVHGFDFPDDEIPNELKSAECQLVLAIANGVDLAPIAQGPAIKREKLGPLETEYDTASGAAPAPILRTFLLVLAPLLSGGGGFSLSVVRA